MMSLWKMINKINYNSFQFSANCYQVIRAAEKHTFNFDSTMLVGHVYVKGSKIRRTLKSIIWRIFSEKTRLGQSFKVDQYTMTFIWVEKQKCFSDNWDVEAHTIIGWRHISELIWLTYVQQIIFKLYWELRLSIL